jgi:flagellar biosynthesis protein FlhG
MKTITITSGKGGVGKTNIAVNLAVSLASMGYKTCLFDADIGLANVNILMGLAASDTLEDVIADKKKLKDIIIKDWNRIDIIPGSSGVEQFETLEKKTLDNLLVQFSDLEGYDYIIIDTGAGISKPVITFCLASSMLVLAIVPEPTSLTDAYSLLKVLSFNGYKNRVNIIVNRCKTPKFGEKVFEKFKMTVSKYINLNLNYLGLIPEDEHVSDSVSNQSPFFIKYPDSSAANALKEISKTILTIEHESPLETKTFDSFIKTCSNLFQSSLKYVKSAPIKNKTKKESKNYENTNPEIEQNENNTQTEIIGLLKKLIKNTDIISQELKNIKKNIVPEKKELNAISYSQYEIETKPSEDDSKPPVLTLDFEKFVKSKK